MDSPGLPFGHGLFLSQIRPIGEGSSSRLKMSRGVCRAACSLLPSSKTFVLGLKKSLKEVSSKLLHQTIRRSEGLVCLAGLGLIDNSTTSQSAMSCRGPYVVVAGDAETNSCKRCLATYYFSGINAPFCFMCTVRKATTLSCMASLTCRTSSLVFLLRLTAEGFDLFLEESCPVPYRRRNNKA